MKHGDAQRAFGAESMIRRYLGFWNGKFEIWLEAVMQTIILYSRLQRLEKPRLVAAQIAQQVNNLRLKLEPFNIYNHLRLQPYLITSYPVVIYMKKEQFNSFRLPMSPSRISLRLSPFPKVASKSVSSRTLSDHPVAQIVAPIFQFRIADCQSQST